MLIFATNDSVHIEITTPDGVRHRITHQVGSTTEARLLKAAIEEATGTGENIDELREELYDMQEKIERLEAQIEELEEEGEQ